MSLHTITTKDRDFALLVQIFSKKEWEDWSNRYRPVPLWHELRYPAVDVERMKNWVNVHSDDMNLIFHRLKQSERFLRDAENEQFDPYFWKKATKQVNSFSKFFADPQVKIAVRDLTKKRVSGIQKFRRPTSELIRN